MLSARPVLASAVQRWVRNLGIDYTGGKKLGLGVRAKRVTEVLRRIYRMVAVGGRGHVAVRYLRSGSMPASLFGCGVSGVPASHMRRLRAGYHKALASLRNDILSVTGQNQNKAMIIYVNDRLTLKNLMKRRRQRVVEFIK